MRDSPTVSPAIQDERVVCGGADSFMTVRHLTVRGTNADIGRAIGQTALKRYADSLETHLTEPIYARARRRYFQRNYPIHWTRMQGVAEAFGVDPEDDRFDLSSLMYRMDLPAGLMGCSAAYFPPSATSSGSGCLSRNYDFSVGSIADVFQLPIPAEAKARLRSLMGEPYIMEWYPSDGGFASIAIQNFDLLGGVLDGVNAAGLVVSINADDEAISLLGPRFEPHLGAPKAIGLHELQLMRMLLDTCATAEEAKDALLGIKDYYTFAPLHYLVADRAGHSFVFENSTGRNGQFVFDGADAPRVLTNFELYRHKVDGPEFDAPLTPQTNAFWRYRKMSDLITAHPGRFGPDDFTTISEAVRAPEFFAQMAAANDATGDRAAVIAGQPLVRTLWHCVYDQAKVTVDISFYIDDDVATNSYPSARRTPYMKFGLARAAQTQNR